MWHRAMTALYKGESAPSPYRLLEGVISVLDFFQHQPAKFLLQLGILRIRPANCQPASSPIPANTFVNACFAVPLGLKLSAVILITIRLLFLVTGLLLCITKIAV